ncbi:DUF4344 domain-containing metallopeptidase [Streptomyces sp. TBY4]|uniref:DUF4344 domain-containing metallopeptidase n=1 Tax=Streptomyces sp. TBY4 TaxID=2962030 RepID=UPI0020B7E4AC|nr:DUF4344 domain-containing metallopeptidase [Streptomyces sp. TBY4]MCP3755547.1 DUF4344 domain-containing metallopeptidase [Streptomyces sp. TBY4]
MNRRWATWGLRATMAALLLAGTGCALLPQEEVPEKGFWLRYEKPAATDEAHARFLKNWQLAEFTLADLNAYVDLPHLVTVFAKSCHGEGTGYDPDTRTIEVCYDDLAEPRELLGDEDLSEVVRVTLYHEAGHALIDALDLPDEGPRAEADTADRFAQVALLRGHPEGEETLLTAARLYDRAIAADSGAAGATDEHAPDAARAESHRCAVYGKAPGRHKDLASPSRTDCQATWTRTRDTWTRDLAPLLRP